MIFIDTHTHLYDEQFHEDLSRVVDRATGAGVTRMMLPAIDSESHESLVAATRAYPDRFFAMMGLHPTSVNENPRWREELETVVRYLENPPMKFYGIGETGLDLYWSRDYLKEQEESLRFQIELSLKYALPIVVHNRDAFDETIRVFSDYKSRGVRGVFHSFCGTIEQYRIMRELGDFRFGIGGVVTYKKSQVATVVPGMELEDIVLETDSPYLTPVPYRGKRNESSYVPYVAAKIAELKGIPVEKVAETTTENAIRLFGLDA